MHTSGKTLVELLVVVAIVALLAGLVLGGVFWARAYAKRANCASNLRQIYIVLKSYVEDYKEPPPMSVPIRTTPPTFQYAWTTLSRYQPNLKSLLICPADPTDGQRTRRDNQIKPEVSSYHLYYVYVKHLPLLHPNPRVVEFYDWFQTVDAENPDEVFVTCEWHASRDERIWALFADGRIGWARQRSCTVDGRTSYYYRPPIDLTEEQCRLLSGR